MGGGPSGWRELSDIPVRRLGESRKQIIEVRERIKPEGSVENLNNQIKKRTRVVDLFPSEESLLRLVAGILIEISESWETRKAYLTLS